MQVQVYYQKRGLCVCVCVCVWGGVLTRMRIISLFGSLNTVFELTSLSSQLWNSEIAEVLSAG